MKFTAFLVVAISGVAFALPSPSADKPVHDLTNLKYRNKLPIAKIAVEKRAEAPRPVKDNRGLHYSRNLPMAKTPAKKREAEDDPNLRHAHHVPAKEAFW